MMTNVDANLYWNKDEFSARFLTGNVGDVSVQRGRVVIAPVLARVEKDAHVSLTARGGVGNALDLARQVGLSKYGSFDFNKIEADGEIEFSLEASLPMVKKRAGLVKRIKTFEATVSNGIFRNLPNSMNITKAELVMNIARENSQITGTAVVYGAPSEFSLDMDHIKGHVDLVAQTPPSESLADAVAQMSGIDIAGAIGGKIAYSGDPLLNEARIGLAADLRGTSINIPRNRLGKITRRRRSGYYVNHASQRSNNIVAEYRYRLLAVCLLKDRWLLVCPVKFRLHFLNAQHGLGTICAI